MGVLCLSDPPVSGVGGLCGGPIGGFLRVGEDAPKATVLTALFFFCRSFCLSFSADRALCMPSTSSVGEGESGEWIFETLTGLPL